MNEHTQAVEKAMTKFPKARRIAVENFTHGKQGKGMTMADHMNLDMDARSYGWKADTIKAIRMVIG